MGQNYWNYRVTGPIWPHEASIRDSQPDLARLPRWTDNSASFVEIIITKLVPCPIKGPHGSNGSISMTATLILYDRSGHKLIED
jgi:hypothetical protein